MKVLICALFGISCVLAGPAKPSRIYFAQENNPDFKRFIYVENDQGTLELTDLEAPDPNPKVATPEDVTFNLFTRQNPDQPYPVTIGDLDELAFSNFDSSKKSVFVAHGWRNSGDSHLNTVIREALFHNHDVNLFIVDWSSLANTLYISAKESVVPVGQTVGNFINELQEFYRLDGSSFVLVGHSLGAHVMGNAGAVIKKKVGHIVGMDPAGPGFTVDRTDNRLDSSDGKHVQVIHTNGAVLGFASSIGDVDFYPNGGMSQPGCGSDLAGGCSHGRSYEYFAESLKRGAVFEAVRCGNFDDYQKGVCSGNTPTVMGLLEPDLKSTGDYFLKTNHQEPFAQKKL